MKQLPLAQKMAKATEMRKLQQQMTSLHTHQKQCEEKVEELQVEEDIVTCIINTINQKVCDVVASVDKVMTEHVNSDLEE